jgi:regulator of replication initiation timing
MPEEKKVSSKLLLITFLGVFVLVSLTASMLVWSFWSQRNLNLNTFKQNIEVVNLAKDTVDKNYNDFQSITSEFELDFSQDENLDEKVTEINAKIEEVQNQKNLIGESNTSLDESFAKINRRTGSQSINDFSTRTEELIIKVKEYNTNLSEYYDFYTCTLNFSSQEINFYRQVIEAENKVKESEDEKALVENYTALREKNDEFADFYFEYKKCFDENEIIQNYKTDDYDFKINEVVDISLEVGKEIAQISESVELDNSDDILANSRDYQNITEDRNEKLVAFRDEITLILLNIETEVNQRVVEVKEIITTQQETANNIKVEMEWVEEGVVNTESEPSSENESESEETPAENVEQNPEEEPESGSGG